MQLYGVPLTIVSDGDPCFMSQFWKSLHEALKTKLHFSTACHPQIDGQFKHMIQTLEDMLRACTLDFDECWDKHQPLVEVAYNNSYQTRLGYTLQSTVW